MKTLTLKIDGMRCGMCESHLNDIVRRNFDVKKVKSSYKKGNIIIILKEDINLEKLKETINSTGYIVENIEVE